MWFHLLFPGHHDLTLDIGRVIHVMVVGAEEDRLTLDVLFKKSVVSARREYIYKCDVEDFLAGDLTDQAVEYHALQLLRGIIFFLRHGDQVRYVKVPTEIMRTELIERIVEKESFSVHCLRLWLIDYQKGVHSTVYTV